MAHGRAIPLVGRTGEIASLESALDIAQGGGKRGVVVVAGPGQGKSALLRQASASAEERGMAVAVVRTPAGTPLPAHFPLGEVVEELAARAGMLGDAATRIAKLARSIEQGGAPSAPQLARALDEVTRVAPLAVFVDDFHWTPPEGSGALVAALRAVEGPVALILTARPRGDEPLPEPTSDLWLDLIEMHGLDRDATAELSATLLGGPVLASSVATLYEATEGNPLHVIETINNGIAEGWLSAVSGYWTIGDDFVARSVVGAITSRLGRLRHDAFEAASAMAVIGRSARVDEILAATGLDAAAAPTALTSLADEGVIVWEPASQGYRLSHPLYQSALLDAIGPVRRALLHGSVLEALRRRQPAVSAAELAHHACEAHERPEDLASLIAAAAREVEQAGSPRRTATWYRKLADESMQGSPEWRDAIVRQAQATTHFDPGAAIDQYTAAIEAAEGAERARLLAGRAQAYQRLGRFDEDLRDLEEALPIADPEDLFSIEDGIAIVHLLSGRREQAAERLQRLVEHTRGTKHHARALFHLAAAVAYGGDVEGLVEISLQAVEAGDDPHLARSARNNAIWGMILLGRWAEAETLLVSAIAEAEEAEDYANLFPILSNSALLYAWKGDTAQALDLAVRSEAVAKRLGNPTDRLKALECMAVGLLEGGEPAGAASLLADVRSILQDHAEAREIDYTYLVMGDVQLALGDAKGAADYCAKAEAALAGDSLIWACGVARLKAQIALADGDAAEALRIAQPWLDGPGAVALENARILEVAGYALHRTGDRAGGHARVQEAFGRYERMGATRRAGAARAWTVLNAPKRLGRPRSTLPAGLTEREHEILSLIVRGRTNREIADSLVLSPSTVKKHVERILAKAGASRRSELGVFAIRIGMTLEGNDGS